MASVDQKQLEILKVLSQLAPKYPDCGKVRIGGPNDGGYVVAKDLSRQKILYSIGVGPQVKFDEELAELGYQVFQYDHTVDAPPATSDSFHFHKLGIAPESDGDTLITLHDTLEMNGHYGQDGLLLKIDIEGCEWDVFDQIDSDILKSFDQIICEIHALHLIEIDDFRLRADRVFRKLKTHFEFCHIHGNNYTEIHIVENTPIPDVIEVLLCRRDIYSLSESQEVFPTSIDSPCDPGKPDLIIGSFKYSPC